MKHNPNFKKNPALAIGQILLWIGIFGINVLELEGFLNSLLHLTCGAGAGLSFVGLLYCSPKTRPMFDRFHAFKLRLLGRTDDN